MMELNVELYKKLYLVRRAEEKIRQLYPENEMKTPMHMSLGEEAIAVGVCHALRKEDQIFGSYRSHAIYLAKTGDTDTFFAELYGKECGTAQGKGGSMHLSAPELGFMGTSAIVASIIPVAVGAAFANQRKGNGKIVAVFFGDGAIDEGDFWESLNVACLMKIPLLFVCEDNGFAVHTSTAARHGYDSITDIVTKFHCHTVKTETTDVESIYNLTCNAITLVAADKTPCFMHLKYYRYLEHVGVYEDFNAGYRPKAEFEEWYKRDPVMLQREKLIDAGLPETEVTTIEGAINSRIENSVSLAKKAAFAPPEVLNKNVFVSEQ